MKTKCTTTTKNGRPCNAWAIRNSSPALCASHSHVTGGGAPVANQNATRHGFYSAVLTEQEAADLLAHAQNDTIEDELALTRVMLRRLLEYLQKEIPEVDETAVTELISPRAMRYFEESARLEAIAPLVYRGTRTVAYLLRQTKPGGGFKEMMDNILDELADELQTQL